MFQIVRLAGVNPQFILFTHIVCSRSVQALAALGGERQQAESPEELANLLNSKAAAIAVPFFDFTSNFDRIRRHCRFVRRSGKAHFPEWIPADVKEAIRVYPTGIELSVETLRQFNSWREMPARVMKQRRKRKHTEPYGFCHGYCN